VNELFSNEQKDWYFYEIESIKADFEKYEKITSDDLKISFTKNSIKGISPRVPGFYNYIVEMKYYLLEENSFTQFATTLELELKGKESRKNHKIHT